MNPSHYFTKSRQQSEIQLANAVTQIFELKTKLCNPLRPILPLGVFREMHCLHHQGDKNRRARKNIFLRSVHRFLVTSNAAPSSLIHITLKMETISSSETRFL
jgi:hypothetical protein